MTCALNGNQLHDQQGRSLDDLPLAAYSTGMRPRRPDSSEAVAEPPTPEPPMRSRPPWPRCARRRCGEPVPAAAGAGAAASRPRSCRGCRRCPRGLRRPRAARSAIRALLLSGVVARRRRRCSGSACCSAAAARWRQAAASAHARAPVAVAPIASPAPGDASVEVTGKLCRARSPLTGLTGAGRPRPREHRSRSLGATRPADDAPARRRRVAGHPDHRRDASSSRWTVMVEGAPSRSPRRRASARSAWP